MPHINTNGIRMYYKEQGTGEPLLLLMGITASGDAWEQHVAFWSQSFRCIMPDNRGVGKTDVPSTLYTTEQMADDCAGLLHAIGIMTVRVVGCSMGSAIAQQLAIRHPQTVQSMVLMCPWARCDNKTSAIFQNIIHCKTHLPPDAFTLYIQLLIFSREYWDITANYLVLENDRVQAANNQNSQKLEGLRGQAAACTLHNTLNDLKQIDLPVLVIGGANDQFTPRWMAEEVAAFLPKANLYLYDGCGHAFHWEALTDFNSRVLNWLLQH